MNRHIAINVDRKMALAVLALIAATLSLALLIASLRPPPPTPAEMRVQLPRSPFGVLRQVSRFLRAGQPAPQP
jgi:hypothetical protein